MFDAPMANTEGLTFGWTSLYSVGCLLAMLYSFRSFCIFATISGALTSRCIASFEYKF